MTDLVDRVPLPEVRSLLRIGDPLPFRVLDTSGRLLLNVGQILADEDQFTSLVERGAWAERPAVQAERDRQRHASARPSIDSQERSLFDQWEQIVWRLDKLTRALVRRQASGSEVPKFLASLQGLVDADPDVALFLCVRQDDRRFALYPLTHALHCAVVGVLAARHLGWSEHQISRLGCSALTMNLTILELQASMAEQGEPPTAKQLRDIRAHPLAAESLLRSLGVNDEDWFATVAEHHERPDGSGYPKSLTQVGASSQVLRVIDVFMAKISPRAKRPAIAPQAAVRQLFQERPNDPLAMGVIKTLGVNPPGSLLRLQSGEIGVAIRRPATGTHPLVATLSDANGRPTAKTCQRDTAQAEFAVKSAVTDSKDFPRVVPERVFGVIPAKTP